MTWFGFLFLYGLICMSFPCQGDIQSPSSGNKMTVLPGSTARIIWSFDDDISDVFLRSWSFTSTDGSFSSKLLARIPNDKNATIYVSFPVIAVEKPATLILKNVNHSFDGKYKFSLSALSDYSSEVFVFIAVKPNLLLNCSSPVTLNEGENFMCLCRGEGGNPPANVTWFKNRVKFTDVGTEKQTLNLLNVGRTDNGTYKCVVTSYSHENYTEEKSIAVTVYYKPVDTSIKFSETPVFINHSVTITCSSIGFPKPDFIISHNDTNVANDMTFTIPRVNRNHAGTYKCVASNFLGNNSDSEFLHVIVKPSVTINCSSPINVRKGDYFICQCMCKDGIPPANCTWLKNGVLIGEIRMEENTLIHRIDSEDGGNYTCVGRSHARAQDKKSISVSVYFKPVNTAVKFSQNPAVMNKSVIITCKSEGIPKPSFIIYHNDTKVNCTGNSYYYIPKVEWKDAGTYKCTAINSFGNDSDSKFLEVTEITSTTTTNARSFPAKTTSYTRVIITSTCISTTSVGPGRNQEGRSSGTEWYIIVVTLVSGIIIGIILSYIVFRVRRKNKKPQLSNPEPPKLRIDSTYQELDLKKMNKEDNYQSLRANPARNDGVNNDESNYTELNKAREVENNYQSLT